MTDASPDERRRRPSIAVFAGPNATVLNTQPLVTGDAARRAHRLASRANPDGRPVRFETLRPQRLAKPVTVYVEQFSAHPLESDSADLYGAPDGYLDANGMFNRQRTDASDVPVYEVELRPDDGLYPLPYVARQADGRPWDGDEADPFGPRERARQPFYPDAARLFEEIDRFGVGDDGLVGQLDRLADFRFYRAAPSGGWTREGERPGSEFFPYRPPHLRRQPSRAALAELTNTVASAMASGTHDGGLWLEGTPFVEETAYWLGLLIDTTRPLAATSSQRAHGSLGNDGDRNVLDSVRYLASGSWADEQQRDSLGAVVVVDQLVIAARSVQKADARPGGYVATGGHGGVLGSLTPGGAVTISWRPVRRATWRSDVRLSCLPDTVEATTRGGGRIARSPVRVRTDDGALAIAAIPSVEIVKHGQYREPDGRIDPRRETVISELIDAQLRSGGLGGLVAEGASPFGSMSDSVDAALRVAVCSGLPVVRTGRGNADGVGDPAYNPLSITAGNLTSSKARLLLMAALLRLGSLPAASDPEAPTPDELRAVRRALEDYQAIFDSH